MVKNPLTLKTNILREIFKIAPKRFKDNDLDAQFLAKKFNLPVEELKKNLEFLFEMRLIKKSVGANYKKDKIFEWEITDKGLDYLGKKEEDDNQKEINLKLLKATIIIAVATALNVLVTLFLFLLNLEKSHWSKPIVLAVIGIAIAGLSGQLFKEIWYLLFPKINRNKTK
jgi:hypothetical protein